MRIVYLANRARAYPDTHAATKHGIVCPKDVLSFGPPRAKPQLVQISNAKPA